MAFNDTLFQLGMDLTRSSTAQKEEFFGSAPGAQMFGNSSAGDTGGAGSAGCKITIDLIGAKRIQSAKSAGNALAQAIEAACGLTGTIKIKPAASGCLNGCHTFAGGKAEVEIWPATGYVAIDVVSHCPIRPEKLLAALMDAFNAREAMLKRVRSQNDGARYKKPKAHVTTMTPRKSKSATTVGVNGARRAA